MQPTQPGRPLRSRPWWHISIWILVLPPLTGRPHLQSHPLASLASIRELKAPSSLPRSSLCILSRGYAGPQPLLRHSRTLPGGCPCYLLTPPFRRQRYGRTPLACALAAGKSLPSPALSAIVSESDSPALRNHDDQGLMDSKAPSGSSSEWIMPNVGTPIPH